MRVMKVDVGTGNDGDEGSVEGLWASTGRTRWVGFGQSSEVYHSL